MQGFLRSVVVSVLTMAIGFMLTKKKLFDRQSVKVLNFIVLNLSVSATAFSSFMSDVQKNSVSSLFFVFVGSLFIFTLSMLLNFFAFKRKGKDKAVILALTATLGQVTLFSLPVVKTVFNGDKSALMTMSGLSLAFRIFLYGYAYVVFSKNSAKDRVKGIKNVVLSPVVIATVIGLFIFITQGVLPKVTIDGQKIGVLRIDKTLPFVYGVIKNFSDTLTPLAMLLVGATVGLQENVLSLLKDKDVWAVSVSRCLIVPLTCVLVCLVLLRIGIVDKIQAKSLIIGFSAPVSAMLAVYANKFYVEEKVVCGGCFLSVVLSIVTLPIVYFIAYLIF